MTAKEQASYLTEVRGFDHSSLAELPSYTRLRQALSDLANEASAADGEVSLAVWLESVRDMTLTAPYGDACNTCSKRCSAEHDAVGACPQGCLATWWPHAVRREGDWIVCTYACGAGHAWTCGYAVDFMRWI